MKLFVLGATGGTGIESAQFLLDEVEHPAHLRRIVGVAEKRLEDAA